MPVVRAPSDGVILAYRRNGVNGCDDAGSHLRSRASISAAHRDRLQVLGIGTLRAVVGRLERDAVPRMLGVLMAVQAELGVEWEVALELEDKRSKSSRLTA
jgi:hypothetical protein